jgi:beta-glucosidase
MAGKLFVSSKHVSVSAIFLLIAVFILIYCGTGKTKYDYPFQDPRLTVAERVDDLVSRLTPEEKVGQMMNAAPAIDRLGIPEYNWWNECLHGVARAGLATVFPQAIGLGAAWDEDLMYRVSETISDEARAKYHEFIRKDKHLIYQGLTFWSPNINIFRDPRWGRGQETYGEDPFLTGRLGVQFIKGLQGDDSIYLKTVATPKHFAVHSGPEPDRHHFNAEASERLFRQFYLPQFEMAVKEANAWSVMCAYNRYNGEACCGSNRMLNEILRGEWGFKGYVVSDCGAIGDIYRQHKLVPTAAEASALAVRSGCDLNCGTVYTSLIQALNDGLILEKELDVAVKRLFTARFKLGMFDPPEMVKYAQIPYSVVDCKAHKDLALEAARKSMVLLKNEDNLLPLKKDAGTIAVIGPNADDELMLLGNYNGSPSDPVTPLRGISEKVAGHSEVLYAKGSELVEGFPIFEKIPPEALSHHGSQLGLQADFYGTHDHRGPALFSEVFDSIDVNWGEKAPRDDMDDDDFGVIWSGEIKPLKSGIYRLGFITTCKTDLYLDDSLIVNTPYHFRDEYGDPRLKKSGPVYLKAGKKYKIRLVAGETYGIAGIELVWSVPRDNPALELKNEALEVAGKSDVIILCMGLSARIEGEEMDVELDGFYKGDRTSLELPAGQRDLIKAIYALGKPVVLVLLNGSPLAVNLENKNIPAILEAWYPGQAAGQAIADVLFGDYNPGGRLPVTFYKSVNDLPPFEQYELTRQTYQYFDGEVLYPFGYGLSYTTFTYSKPEVKDAFQTGEDVPVAINVTNNGNRAGEEVVQLYLMNLQPPVHGPRLKLQGFKRIKLEAGETKRVEFVISANAFSVYNDLNERVVLPGSFEISVGGGQPGTIPETKQADIIISGPIYPSGSR